MAVEMLKPSPGVGGKRAGVSSQFWLFSVALLILNLLRDGLGFWGSTAIALAGRGGDPCD
jgi:hypothetical protein